MKKEDQTKPKKSQKKESSRMVLQGYDLTTAKYKTNLYQKRMMLAVVNAAQARLNGERHVAGKQFKIEEGEFPTVIVPVELILQNEDSSNIYAVRKAAIEIIGRAIEYMDAENNWIAFTPFISAMMPHYGSEIHLQVHKLFWEAILDYRSGYRKFDVRKAMALKSVYAIRFYEIISGKKDPITYSLNELKTMFAIKDKYKLTADFVRYVIEPAKKELDLAAPYSFNYMPVKNGRKIVAFTLTPIHYPQREDKKAEERDLLRKVNLSWDIRDRNIRKYLMESMEFTEVEIKNNIEVFRRAAELLPDCLNELAILKGKSRDKKNPKGWIIRAIEGKVKDVLAKLDKGDISPEMAKIVKKLSNK